MFDVWICYDVVCYLKIVSYVEILFDLCNCVMFGDCKDVFGLLMLCIDYDVYDYLLCVVL